MLLDKIVKHAFLLKVSVILGLFLMFSISLAQNGVWNSKANIPTARSWASSCLLNSKIYVIGGTTGTHYTASAVGTMEVYDPTEDSWDESKADMPTNRVEFIADTMNGKIYAIGGASNHPGSPFATVEEYDPLTDTWDTNKTPMPTARKGAAWGVISNKIYVAGGSTSGSDYIASRKLEIYDPATDTWDVTKKEMTKAVYDPAGTVVNGKLYVIGGLVGSPWIAQKTVQIYDPMTDSWMTGTDIKYGRVGHTADAIDGKIYVIGGDPQSVMIVFVEKYDPALDRWGDYGGIPHGITCHTSNVFDSRIYIFTGSTDDIFNLSPTNAVYSYEPVVSSVAEDQFLPVKFKVYQNYPNPFNPKTIIKYQLSMTNYVNLSIYNLIGQKVVTLVSENQSPGNHQVEWDASKFSSGVYYFRIEAGDFQDMRKMVLLR